MEADREQLLALLADRESSRVERTVSFKDGNKIGEAICAFSNDIPNHRLPGYLFIGVEDQTGQPVGLSVTDRDLQNLAAFRSDGNIQPLPQMSVEVLKHPEGGEVAVIEVLPADLPPVRYRGRVWIRVGPRRAAATEAEERRLAERRVARSLTWDARPCRGASLDNLALELFITAAREPQALSQSDAARPGRAKADVSPHGRGWGHRRPRGSCPRLAARLPEPGIPHRRRNWDRGT